MTAAVVVRGFLRDEFGVLPEDIRWLVGEENGGAMPDFAGVPPAGVSIEILPPGTSLEDRMIDGQLDAIVVLRPSARLNAAASISGRLFERFSQIERQWYEKSRHFPIMHVVGVRSSLVERDPDLPLKLYDAFLEAKRLAIEELEILQSAKVTVPWPHEAVADAKALMGTDYWPYGIRRNRHTLEAQLEWSWLDGLQARRITVDELFHKSLAES
jgi:4,5-dihydroxyphthalate decarboxylase